MLALITEIFCHIDDFCKQALSEMNHYLLPNPKRQGQKSCRMSLSEIMTLLVLFHLSHYRTFKDYYFDCVAAHLKPYFPCLVSYNRFVELMPSAFLPLLGYLQSHNGKETGLYYVDSTDLPVCIDVFSIIKHSKALLNAVKLRLISFLALNSIGLLISLVN